MDIQTLTTFFMWCTILNIGLLLFASLILVFAGDFVYRLHSKWLPMHRETFNVVIYSFLGLFKIIWLVFNVVPYVALMVSRF